MTAHDPAVPEPATETRDTLAAEDVQPTVLVMAEALHDQIDGDFLLMGTEDPGWDVDRVGISEANVRDLVRWAVIALAPLVARIEREARADERERIAAAIEARRDKLPFDWHPQRDSLTSAARIARSQP